MPRRIALSREERWRQKLKTWPNMTSRRDDSTSNEELDGPSTEASEEQDSGDRTSLPEYEVKPSQEELSDALDAGIRGPSSSQEDDDERAAVILKSKDGKDETTLSRDSAKAGDSTQGLHDGLVKSATSFREINSTGGASKSARRSFDCTTCGKRLFSLRQIQEHPDLGVGVCTSCYNFLFSSPYTKDAKDCSEEQCRWCGQGGRIVMCDHCDKSFCESCIIRNYGPKHLALIVNNSNWSCFCCNRELLRDPINEFKEFQNLVQQLPQPNHSSLKRKGAHCARNLKSSRKARDSIFLGDGSTIAELLAQEEERRKQNIGMWTKRVKVKSETHKLARRDMEEKKKATHTLNPKISHPAVTEVKPKHEVATVQRAPATEPAPARTWIRPHQWAHKRQEAAERRKRAEADVPKPTNVIAADLPSIEADAEHKPPSEIAQTHLKSVEFQMPYSVTKAE